MLLTLSVFGVPGSAGAAPQEGDPGDRVSSSAGAQLTATFKLGPFHVSPSLITAAGIGSVPNQRQPDDPERLEIDGFFAARPGVGAALPIGSNHTVTVGAELGTVWYREFSEEDRTTYTVGGAYAYTGSRIRLLLDEEYYRGGYSSFTPLDAGAPPDATLETDDWVPYTTWGHSGEIGTSLGERLDLTIGGEHRTVQYGDDEDAEFFLADDVVVSVDTSLDMALTPFSTVGAVYEWQRADYPDQGDRFRDSTTQTLGLRYAWARSQSFRTGFVAGYRRIDPDNPIIAPYRGWNFAGDLMGELFERLQVGLVVSQSTFRSSYLLNLYGVSQGGAATLSFAASRDLRFIASLDYFVHNYPEDRGAESMGIPRRDELFGYLVGGTWSFARVHSLNFGVGEQRRDSNVERFDGIGLILNLGYLFVY